MILTPRQLDDLEMARDHIETAYNLIRNTLGPVACGDQLDKLAVVGYEIECAVKLGSL